jgi:hypothetical protein
MAANFLKTWLNILRNCNYDNTYKMAWAKAITEIAVEYNYNDRRGIYDVEITLEQIAHKVIKYYWNQTIFFDLIQGSNPQKPPKILSLVKSLIDIYYKESHTKQPIRFERLDLDGIMKKHYTKTIKMVKTTLKADVSYRFLNIDSKKIETIYEYNKGDDSLFIKITKLKILKINCTEVFELINYKWALILETFNSTPRICKKVKIIDDIDISRTDLKRFKKYLDYENPDHTCFICNKKITTNLSIDHVIPWSYLYSNDLWNLVYTHKSCNSSKSNTIPNEEDIIRLQQRNANLIIKIDKIISDKITEELKLAINKNYVKKYWIACQG